ncbi:endonuclease/exonuclease/phosphatase family protein [Labilithrix luteola]|uniref:endonuclease/exonuclease/phosphatase family protein n=1 Tax=Labilithrix luteola TaxID=1391654 RepID=UPI0014749815|nr:endonuclease/exonuclease/phosphatase family protein [Labilithrix luteola]
MSRFRVMTYNVHRCIGTDGKDSIASILRLCTDAEADLIALQELDAPETDEDEGIHHARDLASRLGMQLLFCRTFRRGVGYYGHALLSRYPIELKKVTTFPSPHEAAEPRGAIWARVTREHGRVDVLSTHLGVHRRERAMQSLELVSNLWLGNPDFDNPCVLCGDLNAVPNATTYRRIAAHLRDAQRSLPGHRPRATFPSRLPVLRLDHVFVSPDVRVRAIRVPYNGLSRRASDHLPLVVDVDLNP